MIKKNLFNSGFTLLEIIVSLTIFSLILLAIVSFLISMNNSILKAKAGREVSENAQKAMREITYEIRSARGVYTPTTTESQLSLETSSYLPAGEDTTYIDFFLCGSAICMKKESQDPFALTSSSVNVTDLSFTQVSTGTSPSILISMTLNYAGSGIGPDTSSITLTSTASLRSY